MKEKVLVSACLLGVNCKYSGGNSYNQGVVDFLEDKEAVRICPEALAGLKIPRPSCEIVGDQVIDIEGTNLTKAFQDGAEKVLQLAKKHDTKLAILKSKSPSCGYGIIYDGSFTSKLIEGNGYTAQILIDNGVEIISSDDEKFR